MTHRMTPDELRSAIDKLWNGNQSWASRELGLSSSRRIREFISGDRTIPSGIADDIRNILEVLPTGRKTIDPKIVIRALQSMMVQNGWKPEFAAAGILGVAVRNAEKCGCDIAELMECLHNDTD